MALLLLLLSTCLLHHADTAIVHSFHFEDILSRVDEFSNATANNFVALRSLLSLLKQSDVNFFSLYMSRPAGAVLDISFRTRVPHSRYTRVKQIVASVFCTSLSSNADNLQSKPYIYAPPAHYQEFYPYEVSCTENMNAFISLLPHDTDDQRIQAVKENNSEWFVLAPSNSLMFKTSLGDGDKDTVDVEFRAGLSGSSNGLVINRYLKASDGYSSQVVTEIENNSSASTSFGLKEVVADFYDIMLTTYVICLNGEYSKCESVYKLPSFDLSQGLNCFTAIDWAFELPPYHRLQATYTIVMRFPHMDLLPVEPNRGFFIPPAIITTSSTIHHTTALLCRVLLSDLSMPFNVATLASTTIAFLAGALLNTVSKTFVTT